MAWAAFSTVPSSHRRPTTWGHIPNTSTYYAILVFLLIKQGPLNLCKLEVSPSGWLCPSASSSSRQLTMPLPFLFYFMF